MNRKLIILGIVIVVVIVAVLYLATPRQISDSGLQTEVVAQNLEVPWAIDFLPDGRMIFTERVGRVNVMEGNQTRVVGNITVTTNQESGLMGIAVDPNFNQNKYIYVYYTKGSVNRISRFVLNDKITNETVILDNIPSSPIHNGGRLKFGPDGKLYLTTGDAGNSNSAQDTNSLGGKILRLNSDGSAPTDNPFGNLIYSYGHRDPQGITWSPNGTMYESEHGPTMNDEINIIVKGGNYGWPLYQGNATAAGYIKPLRVYTEFTLAPSGIQFYQNVLYVAGLRGNQLRRITLSNDGQSIIGERATFNNLGRIREVVEHDGYLYVSTSNRDGRGVPKAGDDLILRIKIN
ncbi:MAG TPA: PQQ-dependent sugar dehydrogenase [Methanobacteriaceae archaeon]|nr:PQQ-dependent sugar dehydrogenase [Methanobacteriaceae archaeon]